MNKLEKIGFDPKGKQNPSEVAQERWGVDLDNDNEVRQKLAELQGKMPDVADLSNLWQDHQERKKEKKKVEGKKAEEKKAA